MNSVLSGSIHTLPPHGSNVPLPAVLLLYTQDGPPTQITRLGCASVPQVGWGGISFSPSPTVPTGPSYDSYNTPSMAFYLTPIPGARPQEITVISPISGTMTYEWRGKERGWEGKEDKHNLEGLLVRDCMRVFGGVLGM
ncbi:hypothetical protein TrRE_jg6894 [Triparma retinervis]|uniref:Uncharacterized protein n=1 Tax=Triparma retinervis TaxID=2557542 RepID=A0A9W7L3S0_9STRA|nr:hypothetical protein TrRE_jg6894 [Triparma retinervis]